MHAIAKIAVHNAEAQPYDETAGPETVDNGKIRARWIIVPGSGTGDLSGLRGQGGFEGEFGKGSTGTLDYWFE